LIRRRTDWRYAGETVPGSQEAMFPVQPSGTPFEAVYTWL